MRRRDLALGLWLATAVGTVRPGYGPRATVEAEQHQIRDKRGEAPFWVDEP
jgi:hypothetical protein